MLATIVSSEAFRYLAIPTLVGLATVFVKRRAISTVRAGASTARARGYVRPQLEDASIWVELLLANLSQLLLVTAERQLALDDDALPLRLQERYSDFVMLAPWLAVASLFLLWALADQVKEYRQETYSLRMRFVRAYALPHAVAAVSLIFGFWFVTR